MIVYRYPHQVPTDATVVREQAERGWTKTKRVFITPRFYILRSYIGVFIIPSGIATVSRAAVCDNKNTLDADIGSRPTLSLAPRKMYVQHRNRAYGRSGASGSAIGDLALRDPTSTSEQGSSC